MAAGEAREQMRRRSPLISPNFDLLGGLVATGLAVVAYAIAVSLGSLPPPSASIVLFAAAPICALAAIPVVASRGRLEDDALSWFAAGLAVCVAALLMQLIGFPTVADAGGVLGTTRDSSALLYLTFHVALYGGALAGAFKPATRYRVPAAVAGLILTLLIAVNAVPVPPLLEADQSYTPLLNLLQAASAALGALTVFCWVKASGRGTSQLRGWIGVSLSISTYEVVLNAISSRRFDAVWWSSASLRAIGFAVLAAGCLRYVLAQLSRVENYSEQELTLRESELMSTLMVNDRLLDNARRLSACARPVDIATALTTTIGQYLDDDLSSVSIVSIGPERRNLMELNGFPTSEGPAGDVPDPDGEARLAARAAVATPEFLSTAQDVDARFPLEARRGVQALVALPLSRPVGAARSPTSGADAERGATLVVTRHVAHDWPPDERRLLTGLAYQAEPALARALLAEREHVAAETLQRSLLPRRLPQRGGVELAARYEPAVVGDRVGGDWYDAWWTEDDRLLLVVGDVVGHGIGAAATMGRLRASIRAFAEVDPAPGSIVTRLAIGEGREQSEMVATVLVALLDRGRSRLTVAWAGHLPLLLVAPGREAIFVGGEGAPPLGCPAGPVAETEVDAPDGSFIVLYTDGLVEDRSSSLDDGLRLIARTASRSCELTDPVDVVADALMAARPLDSSLDDVALLVVHLRSGAEQSAAV